MVTFCAVGHGVAHNHELEVAFVGENGGSIVAEVGGASGGTPVVYLVHNRSLRVCMWMCLAGIAESCGMLLGWILFLSPSGGCLEPDFQEA